MEIPERLFKSAEVQCAREATQAAELGISQCVGLAFWPQDVIAELAAQSSVSDVPPGEVLACQVTCPVLRRVVWFGVLTRQTCVGGSGISGHARDGGDTGCCCCEAMGSSFVRRRQTTVLHLWRPP
jgi:hypothetical protein